MSEQSPHPAEPLSRRRFLQLGAGGALVAGTAAFGLTGCGSSKKQAATASALSSVTAVSGSPTPSVSAVAGKSTITLATTSDLQDMLKDPLAQFKAQHGITVNLRIMAEDTSAYFDQMRTQFQAGSSDIDVIAGDVTWPAQFAANGWLADLSGRFTPALQSAYLPATVASNVYKGKIYGVPFYTDAGILYYRKDLLEAAGYSTPPQTWAELQEMALKVMKDAKITNGFVFQGANYEGGTDNGLEYIRTAGGDVLNGTQVIVDQPAAIRGLQIQRGLVTSGVAPAAVAEYKEDESAGAFASGQSVFIRSWGYFDSVIADKTQSKLDVSQVGITPVPVADAGIKPVNVGGGWNLYMNANSHKQDAAWEVISFITAAVQQKIWAIQGDLLPTISALYDDADLGKQVPVIAAGKAITAETTTPPVSPYYSDMSLAMAKHFNANLRGAETSEQAAANLQKELEAIVSRA